jgi:L-fuconolactonase
MSTSRHQEWLNKTVESAIEPEIEICDPHHHLWDFPGSRYLVEELLADASGGHKITKTVFVECRTSYRTSGPVEMKPVGETEFVASITAKSNEKPSKTAVAAGIVGFADLLLGDQVKPVLEALAEAGKGRLRGIRNMSCWDKDDKIERFTEVPELLMNSKFRQGFALLKTHSLSFDAWLYHTQIHELTNLAKAFPDTVIILDHIGGPIGIGVYGNQKEEVFKIWKKDIAEIAKCPNVVVKVGGMAIGGLGHDWYKLRAPLSSEQLAKEFAPWYMYCIEQFGPKRVMLESNYPVDKRGYTYTVLWNALKIMTKDITKTERADLFYHTAKKTYRLP